MNIEDIKVGETYNVRVRVGGIDTNRFVCQPLNQDGTPSDFCPNYFNFAEAEAFSPLSPENGIKNTEPAPKYDQCRLLKKGDRVQVKRRNGRCNGKAGEYLREAFCEVAEDEEPNELVRVLHNATEYRLDPAYLELVTPAEELEPYNVHETEYLFRVMQVVEVGEQIVSEYRKSTHPHAKEAAEAERDRLNAEWRKEQSNA